MKSLDNYLAALINYASMNWELVNVLPLKPPQLATISKVQKEAVKQ